MDSEPVTRTSRAQLSKWPVDLMSGMTWISPSAYVWMAVTSRVSYMEQCFPPHWNTWRQLVSKQQLSCAHVWLCNNNSELATLHSQKTGPGKIRQIFIISRGPILVKCPSVSDSLPAGSASGDNSEMNSRFNQLCISLVIKVWDVITTVKTYLHFILFFGKWMSLEILMVPTDFDTVCNRSPCTLLMSSCRETPVSSSASSKLTPL